MNEHADLNQTFLPLPDSLPIRVITLRWLDQSWIFESEKIIDHNNSSDRKWLGTHCFWAMRNSRMVTTYPIFESC